MYVFLFNNIIFFKNTKHETIFVFYVYHNVNKRRMYAHQNN